MTVLFDHKNKNRKEIGIEIQPETQIDDRSGEEIEEEKGASQSAEFARLLEDSFRKTRKSLSLGEKVKSEILSMGKEEIFVSTGTMHDGLVPRKDLLNAEGQLIYKVGDRLDLFVTHVRGSEIYLSSKPTGRNTADDLEDAFDQMLPVQGKVTEVCKGGFRVLIQGKTAFCPISQMDLRRIEVPEDYVGKRFEFLVTQFSEAGRNIVVSRRKLLDEQKGISEVSFQDEHPVGEMVPGTVTRLEKFGAFVELSPGMEGLVHISELAWSRVADPQEVVQVGQPVQVKILGYEEKDGRLKISLSLKQGSPEPWASLPSEIQVGNVIEGKVTRCMKFGAFVELSPGIEGLVPLSEMSDTKRVMRSDELIHEGERISVLIKDVSPSERRILLSFKDVGKESDGTGGDSWKGFNQGNSGSFGTLGDQFRQAIEKRKKA